MSEDWPSKPRGRLVDQDPGVRQREALAVGAAHQQQRAHRHRDPDAHRRHVGLDEVHRVVDRQAGVDRAAGRVDVDRDVLVGVGALQVQELRDDEVRDLVVDRAAEEDDPLVEQAGVDVVLALAAGGALDHHRDHGHADHPSGRGPSDPADRRSSRPFADGERRSTTTSRPGGVGRQKQRGSTGRGGDDALRVGSGTDPGSTPPPEIPTPRLLHRPRLRHDAGLGRPSTEPGAWGTQTSQQRSTPRSSSPPPSRAVRRRVGASWRCSRPSSRPPTRSSTSARTATRCASRSPTRAPRRSARSSCSSGSRPTTGPPRSPACCGSPPPPSPAGTTASARWPAPGRSWSTRALYERLQGRAGPRDLPSRAASAAPTRPPRSAGTRCPSRSCRCPRAWRSPGPRCSSAAPRSCARLEPLIARAAPRRPPGPAARRRARDRQVAPGARAGGRRPRARVDGPAGPLRRGPADALPAVRGGAVAPRRARGARGPGAPRRRARRRADAPGPGAARAGCPTRPSRAPPTATPSATCSSRAVVGLLDAEQAQRPVILFLDDVQWADTPTLLLLRHLVALRPAAARDDHRDVPLDRAGRRPPAGQAAGRPAPRARRHARRPRRAARRGRRRAGARAASGRTLDAAGHGRRAHAAAPDVGQRVLRHRDAAPERGRRPRQRGRAGQRPRRPGAPAAAPRRRASATRWRPPRSSARSSTWSWSARWSASTSTRSPRPSTPPPTRRWSSRRAIRATATRSRTALIVTTLYEGLGPARRARMHRRAAEALEAMYGDRTGGVGSRVGELARHWLNAEPADLDARAALHAPGRRARASPSWRPTTASTGTARASGSSSSSARRRRRRALRVVGGLGRRPAPVRRPGVPHHAAGGRVAGAAPRRRAGAGPRGARQLARVRERVGRRRRRARCTRSRTR